MDFSVFFSQGNGIQTLPAFATSLAIGLLIGLERERSPAAKAGLRTFTLVSMLGTLAALLSEHTGSPWLLLVVLAGVIAIIVGAYAGEAGEGDPGTTTQAALIVSFGLGAAVWYGYGTLAIMLAIVTTMLLYFKPELHSMSQSLSRNDLRSILQFAVLSLVVLPVLPDQNYGPYSAFNPYRIWLVVVLISGISLAGYVALRVVGQRYGATLLGFFGGLVSSTATTLVYVRHGKANEMLIRMSVVVILIANLMVLVRIGVLSSIVAPGVLPHLLPVLLSGLVLGGTVTFLSWHRMHQNGELPIPHITNPTEIRTSLGFGLLYAGVLFCTSWLSHYAGSGGLYALAMVSGLVDVDAITLSSLHLSGLGQLGQKQAVTMIAIACLSNLAFKLGLIFVMGGGKLARLCVPGMLAVGLGVSAAWLLGVWMGMP